MNPFYHFSFAENDSNALVLERRSASIHYIDGLICDFGKASYEDVLVSVSIDMDSFLRQRYTEKDVEEWNQYLEFSDEYYQTGFQVRYNIDKTAITFPLLTFSMSGYQLQFISNDEVETIEDENVSILVKSLIEKNLSDGCAVIVKDYEISPFLRRKDGIDILVGNLIGTIIQGLQHQALVVGVQSKEDDMVMQVALKEYEYRILKNTKNLYLQKVFD